LCRANVRGYGGRAVRALSLVAGKIIDKTGLRLEGCSGKVLPLLKGILLVNTSGKAEGTFCDNQLL